MNRMSNSNFKLLEYKGNIVIFDAFLCVFVRFEPLTYVWDYE